MAPIRFLVSALAISAAIAAPINTNKVDSGEDGESTSTLPIQHQSEPMRQADPVVSSIPSGTVDIAAMKSSAAAAAGLAADPLISGQEDDSAFGMLEKLPRGYEWLKTRRQLDEVTKLLTELNHVGKRDVDNEEDLEARQLGLVKSVPEAAGQIAHVLATAESLPIKRQLGGALAGLGGVSGILDDVKRDVEEAEDAKKKPTYTEQALRGFLHKHEPAQDDKKEAADAAQSLGLDVAKRGEADDVTKKYKYTDDVVKSFLHKHVPAQDDKKEAAKTAQSLGLDVNKRGDDARKLTYTEQALRGFLHKHEPAQDDAKEAEKASESLGLDIPKRDEAAEARKKTYTEQALRGFLHQHSPAQDDAKKAAEAAAALGVDVAKRAEEADARKHSYTEQALRGFLHKHEPAEDDAKKAQEAAQSLGVDGLGGVAKRAEDADARKPTYTEEALRGFLHKHEPAQDDAKNAQEAAQELGVDVPDVSKRIINEANDATKKPTYTEKALKGFFHKGPAQDDAKEAQSAAQSLGVGGLTKPSDGDSVSDHMQSLGDMEAMLSDLDKRQVSDPLGIIGGITGLIGKRGDDPLAIVNEILNFPDDVLGVLRKRVEEEALGESAVAKKPTYTEQALKGFFHNGPAQDDAKEAQEAASSLGVDGLGSLGKRDNGGPLGLFDIVSGLGIIGKRESDSSSGGGDPLGVLDTIKGLGIMGKRGDGDPLNLASEVLGDLPVGLRKKDEGALDESALSKRQLGIVSSLATSSLSNAGSAAGSIAKVISGKRDDGNAESTTEAAMAGLIGMGMGQGKKKETDVSDIAEQFHDAADAQNTGSVLAGHSQPPSGNGAQAKGSLAKRQVPPIAGSDLLSITKGLLADPSKAVKPVTEGILVGGNSLESLAQPK